MYIKESCNFGTPYIYEKRTSENTFLSIDDLNEEEDDELREELDMHLVIPSIDNLIYEPLLTAEQVISEINFMLEDTIPDLSYCVIYLHHVWLI
jgi:hypothetical protein